MIDFPLAIDVQGVLEGAANGVLGLVIAYLFRAYARARDSEVVAYKAILPAVEALQGAVRVLQDEYGQRGRENEEFLAARRSEIDRIAEITTRLEVLAEEGRSG